MAERANKPIAVGVLARGLLSRLDKSAKSLSSNVRFECATCEDTGLIRDGSRYKKCEKCSNAEPQRKGIFF